MPGHRKEILDCVIGTTIESTLEVVGVQVLWAEDVAGLCLGTLSRMPSLRAQRFN